MLKVSHSIKDACDLDIGDNLYYYNYSVKHLLSLIRKGIDRESPEFISSYRSFEGEVFENYIYEKLLRYAQECDHVEQFVIKGAHSKNTKSIPNTISVNEKGQIVCRTNRNEIGEFDALIFTKNELYFVEMTLVKSVSSLRKRLRKKIALLEAYFPNLKVKALLILNEGVVGTRVLPEYATTWIVKPYSAEKILEWIVSKDKRKLKPFEKISGAKMIGTDKLKMHPFKYYNTLTWILRKLRADRSHVLDIKFLTRADVIRYHELYTKIYIGYMSIDEFKKMAPNVDTKDATKVIVCMEKEHTGNMRLIYFVQHARKNLDMVEFKDGNIKVSKKDPFGISVNEVTHITKTMDEAHILSVEDIEKIDQLI